MRSTFLISIRSVLGLSFAIRLPPIYGHLKSKTKVKYLNLIEYWLYINRSFRLKVTNNLKTLAQEFL